MHIIYFHQHFSTPNGATGIRSYEMAKRLLSSGHTVTMVCGSYGIGTTGLSKPFVKGQRRGMIDGIDVIELDLSYSNSTGLAKRALLFLKFAMKSLKIAMVEKYDVVFATTTPLTAGIPGICARWLRGKKFVFEVRDLWPELPKEMGVIKNPVVLGALSVLEWVSYRSAHRCVALSPGIAKGIERRGVSADKIELVPNGCDLEIFSNPDIKPFRPASVEEADLMLVFTGTHGLANGLDNILDTAAELKKRDAAGIKFVLAGSGKLKPALQARAEQDGLDNVIFLDSMPKDQLACLMRGADMGVQCLANVPAFYYGTSPNKFFDYIAAGLPVVNNYPGWIADMVQENECGCVVEPDSPEKFAEILINLDRSKLEKMGRNSLAIAQKEFNRDTLAKRWMDWVLGSGK